MCFRLLRSTQCDLGLAAARTIFFPIQTLRISIVLFCFSTCTKDVALGFFFFQIFSTAPSPLLSNLDSYSQGAWLFWELLCSFACPGRQNTIPTTKSFNKLTSKPRFSRSKVPLSTAWTSAATWTMLLRRRWTIVDMCFSHLDSTKRGTIWWLTGSMVTTLWLTR